MVKKRKRIVKAKLDSKKIAKDLGAKHITDPTEKKDFEKKYGWPRPLAPVSKKNKKKYPKGLEVTLSVELNRRPHRVSYFPLECLKDYDLEQKKVILSPDYRAWRSLSSGTFFFMSPLPDRPLLIFVPNKYIVSIRRLSDGKVLYKNDSSEVMP